MSKPPTKPVVITPLNEVWWDRYVGPQGLPGPQRLGPGALDTRKHSPRRRVYDARDVGAAWAGGFSAGLVSSKDVLV